MDGSGLYFMRYILFFEIVSLGDFYVYSIVKTQPNINLSQLRLRLDIIIKPNPLHPTYQLSKLETVITAWRQPDVRLTSDCLRY